MSLFRNGLLRENGFEIGRDCVVALLHLVDGQPFIGPIALALQMGIQLCDNFRANKDAAASLKERMLDIACLIDIASKRMSKDFIKIEKFVTDLAKSLADANTYLQKFTQKGFLGALLLGDRPARRFRAIDKELTQKLNTISLAFQLTSSTVQEKSYDVVCNIEAWLHENGGLAAIANDSSKLEELAEKMDANLGDLRDEVNDSLSRLELCLQNNFEDVNVHMAEIMGQLNSLRQALEEAKHAKSPQIAAATTMQHFPQVDMSQLKISRDRILGEGGFGIVYAGVYSGDDVAIKTMKRNDDKIEEDLIKELSNEVCLLHIVGRHPCIVKLYGANVNRSLGELCLVMELADGTLDDAIHSDKLLLDLTMSLKIKIAIDVASAMDALGTLKIYFRDAKPLNILLFVRGTARTVTAKIADFGLAKVATANSTTGSFGPKGTPPYMAPELFVLDRQVPYSCASDVYAFGILLNELLTEKYPVVGRTIGEIVSNVIRGVRPEIFEEDAQSASTCGSQTIAIVSLIQACFSGDPDGRPSFSAILADLRQIAQVVAGVARQGALLVRRHIALQSVMQMPMPAVRAAPVAAGSGSGSETNNSSNKPLADLTVNEVVYMVQKLEMPDKVGTVIQQQKIKGHDLCHMESADELRECGIELPKFQQRAFYAKLIEFRSSGVPPAYLMTGQALTKTDELYAAPPAIAALGAPIPLATTIPIVGARARILEVTEAELAKLQRGHGGYAQVLKLLMGTEGTVKKIDDDGDAHVEFAPELSICWHPAVVVLKDGSGTMSVAAAAAQNSQSNQAIKVDTPVRIIETTVEEAVRMQQGHGGINDKMKACLGKVGKVTYVFPDGDVRVLVGEDNFSWNRSLVVVETSNMSSTLASVAYCKQSHSMTRNTSKPTGALASVCCGICSKQANDFGDNYFSCPTCSFCVCSGCSSMRVGSAVRIKQVDEQEMRSQQRGHGGFKDTMMNSVGRKGFVYNIDSDGDIGVIFAPENRTGLGDSKGFFYNPSLVAIDCSFKGYPTGSNVRIRSLGLEEVRRLQESAGGFNDSMKGVLGTVGVVIDFCLSGQGGLAVCVSGENSNTYLWNPEMLESPDTTPGSDPVTDLVTIRAVPDTEAVELQKGHGSFTTEMLAMLGKTGRVVRIDSDHDIWVFSLGRVFCWNPKLIAPVTSGSVTQHKGEWREQSKLTYRCAVDEASSVGVYFCCQHGAGVISGDHWSCCGKTSKDAEGCDKVTPWCHTVVTRCLKGHDMEKQERKTTNFVCDGCFRQRIETDKFFFGCRACNFDLCIICSSVGTQGRCGIIRNLAVSEMRSLQQGHGGFRDYMGSLAGKKCFVTDVDSDGDIGVVFYEDADRKLLPSGTSGFYCNPRFLVLDGSRAAPCINGSMVRIKLVSESELRQLQEGYGGTTAAMTSMMGRIGFIEAFRTKQISVRVAGESAAWNPQLLEPSDGLRDIKVGQRVRIVQASEATATNLMKYSGGYNARMKDLLGKYGTVVATLPSINSRLVKVDVNGTVFVWHPALIQLTNAETEASVTSLPADDGSSVFVRIKSVSAQEIEKQQEGHGGCNDTMKAMAGKSGKVLSVDKDGDLKVEVEGKTFCWNPALVEFLVPTQITEVAKRLKVLNVTSRFQIDSEVTIKAVTVSEAETLQRGHGGINDSMKAMLGKKGKVVAIDSDGDVRVDVGGKTFVWNPEILEKDEVVEDALVKLLLYALMARG